MAGMRGELLTRSLAAGLVFLLPAGARSLASPLGSASIGELRGQGAEMEDLEGAPVPGPRESLDKAEVAARAYPYARLSANAYDGGSEDWCAVIDRRRDEETGFDAYACREVSTGRVIVVFRGTDELKDWLKTDIPQPLFVPRQYRQGFEYAREMAGSHGDVALTGHSMGGGIAQYAASRLGLEAWTFNPAGLGLVTMLRAGSCDPGETCRGDASRITNVIVAGEPLAAARFFLGPDFVKLRGSVEHFLPAGGGGLTSHGMSNVLAALESKQRRSAGAQYASLK